MKTVTKKIKALRLQNERSQTEIARAIGISTPAYSKIESGFTDVNLSRLVQLAEYFKVDVAIFFEEQQNERISELEHENSALKNRVIELQDKIIEQKTPQS